MEGNGKQVLSAAEGQEDKTQGSDTPTTPLAAKAEKKPIGRPKGSTGINWKHRLRGLLSVPFETIRPESLIAGDRVWYEAIRCAIDGGTKGAVDRKTLIDRMDPPMRRSVRIELAMAAKTSNEQVDELIRLFAVGAETGGEVSLPHGQGNGHAGDASSLVPFRHAPATWPMVDSGPGGEDDTSDTEPDSVSATGCDDGPSCEEPADTDTDR